MTSLIESKAQFAQRALEMGMDQGAVDAFVHSGIDTLRKLAFAAGQPGQAIVTQDVDQLLRTTLGRAPALAEISITKALAFEAQTYLVASIKQTLEHQDDSTPRKIASAERSSRMDALRCTLSGLSITGELSRIRRWQRRRVGKMRWPRWFRV